MVNGTGSPGRVIRGTAGAATLRQDRCGSSGKSGLVMSKGGWRGRPQQTVVRDLISIIKIVGPLEQPSGW